MRPLSTSLEDYLEAIYSLRDARASARAVDISRRLGLSKPSVNAAVKALAARGLLRQEPYGRIILSPRGLKAGEAVARKHDLLKDFFTEVLGLPAAEAEKDACRAEHALSRGALRRLGALGAYLKAPVRRRLVAAALKEAA